jgi:hypothetical protein
VKPSGSTDRRAVIRSGEESVLCSTALLRRGLISADFPKGDMTALDRITTEYIDTEDHLRLSGQYANGPAVVVWLTQLQILVGVENSRRRIRLLAFDTILCYH